MSAFEPASSSARASSTSSTSSSIPTACVADSFEPERIPALRQSLRGMETELVDLMFQSSPPGQLMDWLRVPLECATVAGNLSAVKRLLAAGVKTEKLSERSQSAPLLHLAAENGSEGVVKELLKAGIDVHESDDSRDNRTALHCAVAVGSGAAVRALISAGARINVLDANGWTPLHHACTHGHRGVVLFLLLKGARTQKLFGEEQPPLHLAAIHNHPRVIEDLLSFGNVSISLCDRRGRSALHVAAQYRRVEACVALLRGGAAVDPPRSHGDSCLAVAVLNGHSGQLLQVLATAVPTDARRRVCSIALYHALLANNPDTVRDLIALGADVEYRRLCICPNLHFAVLKCSNRAAEVLLRAGAQVDARFNGSTPLHFACSYSHPSTVQLLLHWGADETTTDSDGKTPSEVVGAKAPNRDKELFTEEFIKNKLVRHVIREMLKTAPQDRRWRRRGWLVLCRARWLARIDEREKRSSAPRKSIADCATVAKKRRGKIPDSALVGKPRVSSLDKGNAQGQNEGGGRHLPEATMSQVLGIGICGLLSDGGAGQAAEVARLAGRTRLVVIVEQLLLLREDSIFREVITFL